MALPALHATLPASRRGIRVERGVVVLVAIVALAWFLPLGARHLLPSDEGRYAEIAREMWASGDWITIRYNGLKYFEKPPFQMWATALAYTLFGVGEWQARLWVAIGGAAGLAVSMLAAHRWYGRRVAIFTGLILLSAPAWNIASHFNSLDMGIAAALACALAGLLLAQHPDATPVEQRRWMWFAWGAMAIAVLTKGLIGIVLPGLVLVLYTLASRDLAIWRRLHAGGGLLIFLAIAEPWFVLISQRDPQFLWFFFVHEHFARYLSSVHHRDAPWWYFLPQLLAGMLPWLGLSRRMAGVVRDERRSEAFRPALLLGIWAGAILVFFSLSRSKLPGYIIPIYPALAILAAMALDRLDAAAWRRHVLIALCVLVAGGLALPLLARQGHDAGAQALYRAYAVQLAAVFAIAACGLAAALWLGRRHLDRSITAYALSMFALVSASLVAHETFGRESSGVGLVAPIERVLTPDMAIYSVRLLDHTLPFYLRRTTVMVEAPDELEFGTKREPQKWIPTLDGFVAVWSTGPHAVAVMSHETHEVLRRRGVPLFDVAADARRVVVANFAPVGP